jgi:GNAT superfamily N-acetyltransferase
MAPDVNYRPARAEDIPDMADLFLAASADMLARTATAAAVPPRPAVLVGYGHVLTTGIFHVVEVDGRIGGIAGAIVRERLWYLSSFWVHPELQGQGLGGPLLGRVHVAIPGINHAAIGHLLQAGLRLSCFYHPLTSAPFGRLDQYVASGPGLF